MEKKKINIILSKDLYKYTLIIELVIIFAFFQIMTSGVFMSVRNMSNLLMQGATCSLIAITMMMVVVSKNADLSAGTALGFFGVVAAFSQVNLGLGTISSILFVLVVALVVGLWHGYWIAYKGLPAFIVTYASQLLFKAGTLFIGEGISIGPVKETFAKIGKGYLPDILSFGGNVHGLSLIITLAVIAVYVIMSIRNIRKNQAEQTSMAYLKTLVIAVVVFVVASVMIFYQGFTFAIIILAALTLIFDFVIRNTPFGRYVFAIGGNVEAAKLSGINTKKTQMMIYILHGLVVGVASIVFLGRVGQATSSAGVGFEFIAITGCVVGGTSILGGRGTVLGAVVGTMLMASLDNGMSLMNLGPEFQYMVKGLVLMMAIAIDVISKKGKK